MVQRIQIMPKIAVTSTHRGEMARRCTAGIFYAYPVTICGVAPVWWLNGPTALVVEVNGSAAPFFFAAYRIIISGMTSTGNNCLKGNNSTQQATDAHETGFTTLIEKISDFQMDMPDVEETREALHEMFLDWIAQSEDIEHVWANKMVWCYRDLCKLLDHAKSIEEMRGYIHSVKYPNAQQNPRFGMLPKPELTIVN